MIEIKKEDYSHSLERICKILGGKYERGVCKIDRVTDNLSKIMSRIPKPGDLVRVASSDDVLIEEGSYGVIEGLPDEIKDEYMVTFNFITPWWDKVINASGGPVRGIKSMKMIPTGEKKRQLFKYWEGLPAPHSAKLKEEEVDVFLVDLHDSW